MTINSPYGDLAALVRASAAARPDHPALLAGNTTVTWRQLERAVDGCARGLLARGLQPGDRVAVQLGNTPDLVVALFGTLRAGLVAVPVNPGATLPELTRALVDSGARLLFSASDVEREQVSSLADVVAAGPALDALVATPGDPVPDPAGGEHLALVLYTSGTSGRPRGAMLSHRALLANLAQTAAIDPPTVTADDVVLLVVPLFHVYGLSTLFQVASTGATALLVERFDAAGTLAQVRQHEVTTLVGAPPMYVAWSMLTDVGDAFSSVRVALSGAAPLPAAVLARMLDLTGHHVFEGYGLTETAPVLTTTLMSEAATPDSIGRPVPGVDLRLVAEDGGPVEDDDPGEIVVRGANLFSGYWPDGADGPDAEGWWATGDVAVTDANGDLHLVDRRRELILVSGFNVYPREVEDVLLRHEAVAEAAVLGVPDPHTGEAVRAVVVLAPGGQATEQDLIAFAARSLARFKCPSSVEIVEGLPHTATGKISKARLREEQS